jgi:cytochrome c
MKKIALLALIMFSGCGEDEGELLTQQIEKGVSVYTAKCAGCHGAMGQGTDLGPAVVGQGVFPKQPRQGAVRNVEFKTALDVFVWAKANMPGDAPGTMSDEDMLAVFAFDLDANGVTLEKPLDGDSASKIVLNP